jgi:hypothetical protein
MTTTVDELMADHWNQHHLYDAEVICDCGEAWTIRCIDGRPREISALRCDVCGEEGRVQ